jgi:single-strand DNA-binding protein
MTATCAGASSPGEQHDGQHDGQHDVEQHNEVRLQGRVSGTPERRRLPSGDEVVQLRVVLTRPDGVTDTIPVQVGPAPGRGRRARSGQTGRRALNAAQRLPPGTWVAVDGRLQRRWWQAGGGRRSRIEVVATVLAPVTVQGTASGGDDAGTGSGRL